MLVLLTQDAAFFLLSILKGRTQESIIKNGTVTININSTIMKINYFEF